ncbi:MAG: hypothetical protein COB85_09820 [Bacteroidetes bacterium]|nr:MAG: hypothetical protein COB85_09820 [Bacteroidota bacterium]
MLNKKMVTRFLILLLLQVLIPCSAFPNLETGKDTIAIRYGNTITSKDIKAHLTILASDEYEGRETGEEGQKRAAKYISKHFSSVGIPPYLDSVINDSSGYYQKFPLVVQSPYGATISSDQKTYEFIDDFFFFSGFEDFAMDVKELILLGYGIESEEYNDYAEVDVKDKWILFLSGEPLDKKGNSLITGTKDLSEWSTNWRKKRNIAKEKEVAGMFIISQNYEDLLNSYRHYIEKPSVKLISSEKDEKLPRFYLSIELSNKILEATAKGVTVESIIKRISKKRKPYTELISSDFKINIERDRTEIESENVLGYIEGTDKKDELIVITAHYDHLGIDGDVVYNGADDDGSGTVALLELAEAFAMAKADGYGTRRSILIMPVSGEEKGLLGSKYYTSNPVYPLDNTVANLNIDMIGRIDTIHKGNPNYVYLIGADRLSQELHDVSERANTEYINLELDYRFNDEDDPNRFYYRSDHYNFAKKNVPVIFYFNGVHEDYHQPTDTVDKIDFDKMEKITRLIYFTAWELANMENRIKMIEDPKE